MTILRHAENLHVSQAQLEESAQQQSFLIAYAFYMFQFDRC